MSFKDKAYERMIADMRHEYFNYLCGKIDSEEFDQNAYIFLLKQLFRTTFVVRVEMDENRAADGRMIREDFVYDQEYDSDFGALDMPCTILELLIGIAIRMDFDTCEAFDKDDHVPHFFALLIRNLGLDGFDDDAYSASMRAVSGKVNKILNDFCYRAYEPDGKGGLFPLKNPGCDQREVEIWNQMFAYIDENF